MPEILIYDEIGGTSGKAFRETLDSIEATNEPLTIRINSVGGVVFEGLAMHSAIQSYPGKVTAIVEGIAGSIASIIALAADEVVMAEGAFFMVHNPFAPAQGTADDLRKSADDLEKLQSQMVAIYESATGLEASEVKRLMDSETYLNAEESVSKGFASRIEGAANYSMAAVARLSNPPPAILAKLQTKESDTMTDEEKAKMKALEEECAKLKAECEEMKKAKSEDDDAAKSEDDDAEEMKASDDDAEEAKAEDDDEEAKASLLAQALAITGKRSFAAAEGALMALQTKAGAVEKTARAAEVDGLIKAGKLAPAQKRWALKASSSALNTYKASLGDAQVIPTHEHQPAAKVEHSADDTLAAKIKSQMGGK